jgi:hypothetical protein
MKEQEFPALRTRLQAAVNFLTREQEAIAERAKAIRNVPPAELAEDSIFQDVSLVGTGPLTMLLAVAGEPGTCPYLYVPFLPSLSLTSWAAAALATAMMTVLRRGKFDDVWVGVVDEHREGVQLRYVGRDDEYVQSVSICGSPVGLQ